MDALELDLEVPDDATPEMVAAKVWLAGRKLTTDQREALLKATNGHDPGTVAAAEKRAKGIYYAMATRGDPEHSMARGPSRSRS